MSRPLLVLALLLVVLGGLARLTCGGGGQSAAAPDTPVGEAADDTPAVLDAPGDPDTARGDAADETDAGEAEATSADEDSARVILAGLVLDGGGAGVPGATVQVERHTADEGGFGMRMIEVQPLPELTTTTDAEGRFEVRGEEEGDVVVRAAKQGHVLREEVECTLPDTRVTLVVERAGAILATVAPESHELAEKVHVEVRSPGEPRDVSHALGSFRAGRALRPGLVPGPYDVVLVGRVSRRPVLTVAGVQVRAGETTADPRLQGLDLRGVMQKIRVTVVDPEDRPMPGVTVWVHHGAGENGQRTGADGSIELGAGVDGVDVAVRETGWRKVRHEAVSADLVIRLEPPIAVRLIRPEGRSAALGDLYVYLERVLPEGVTLTSQDTSDWTLAADEDAVEVAIDAAGRYRVKWAAEYDFAGRGKAFFYPENTTPQEFDVAEDTGLQEVTLALEEGAVEELLARMVALADELQQQPGETDGEFERRVLEVILRENRR